MSPLALPYKKLLNSSYMFLDSAPYSSNVLKYFLTITSVLVTVNQLHLYVTGKAKAKSKNKGLDIILFRTDEIFHLQQSL